VADPGFTNGGQGRGVEVECPRRDHRGVAGADRVRCDIFSAYGPDWR